jgi:anti-sigma regulatory factor (Ser/Thr protein kinase)
VERRPTETAELAFEVQANPSFEGYRPGSVCRLRVTRSSAGRGEESVGVAATANTSEDKSARLSLRLAARPAQAFLLRAQLRLWLTEQHAAEDEVLDVLVAANEAFSNALVHARQPRSIAVHVEARLSQGVVEIVIRDRGHWQEDQPGTGAGLGLHLMHALMDTVDIRTTQEGTTVRLRRVLGLRLIQDDEAATAPAHDRFELLTRNSIFAPLPGAMLERLAAQLIPVSASVDETILRQGEHGDRFYLIAKGQLDVSTESRHVATLGPGDHVGEIALLRDVPRTATVIAKKPVELYALTPEHFLSAVTSHAASTRAAQCIVATRLTELQEVLGRTPLPRA